MMTSLNTDFVRYVMHVQVVQQPQPAAPAVTTESAAAVEQPNLGALAGAKADAPRKDGAPEKPKAAPRVRQVAQAPATTNVQAAKADARALTGKGAAAPAAEPEKAKPVVKDEWDKTPRNAPCPCESGKKFKNCHGRN